MPWSAADKPKWIMCRWIDVQLVVPETLQGSWHVTMHLAWLARTKGILLELQHKRQAEKLNKLLAFIESRARNCIVTNRILCVQRVAMVLTNITHFFLVCVVPYDLPAVLLKVILLSQRHDFKMFSYLACNTPCFSFFRICSTCWVSHICSSSLITCFKSHLSLQMNVWNPTTQITELPVQCIQELIYSKVMLSKQRNWNMQCCPPPDVGLV